MFGENTEFYPLDKRRKYRKEALKRGRHFRAKSMGIVVSKHYSV